MNCSALAPEVFLGFTIPVKLLSLEMRVRWNEACSSVGMEIYFLRSFSDTYGRGALGTQAWLRYCSALWHSIWHLWQRIGPLTTTLGRTAAEGLALDGFIL